MKVAVLPFNAAEGTKPAYGRQFAAFTSEQLRSHAEAEINTVSYLTQIEGEDGVTRMAFVNIPDEFLPYEQLADLFNQADAEVVMDGMLAETEAGFELSVRFHEKGNEEPIAQSAYSFKRTEIFATISGLVSELAHYGKIELPDALKAENVDFGTKDGEAFLDFLEGFDSLNYIQQANGQVALEFSPLGAIDALLSSVQADPTFEGPYHVLVQLCRACGHYRIGNFQMLDEALQKLEQLRPAEFGASFALGELHQSVNSLSLSSEFYEKAVQKQPNDPGLLSRLGAVQAQLGMPVNAERNFRKALELEDDEKPSADMLAMVLGQTGREHEIPSIWKGIIAQNPQNGVAHAKYAMALFQAGKETEGEAAFESALDSLEDNTVIKRFFAPILVQREDFDRAMDFYEDVLDVAPTEIPVLIEYAQTLEAADRAFEVPPVLKTILSANPDANIRAQVLARLIELEQPKRAESVEAAREKMEQGDFQGALAQLKPMRNWLADYWKMWALLASAYNRTEQPVEAEEAAKRLLELFPGCEPGFGELREALVAQGKSEEAYQLLRFAASNNQTSLAMMINFAMAAKSAGHVDEARELVKQIREAVGNTPDLAPVLDEIES